MAATRAFDGPIGIITATIMARANRAVEEEAVAALAPGPGDDVLVPVRSRRTHVTADTSSAALARAFILHGCRVHAAGARPRITRRPMHGQRC